jgi:hypothetical protein
MTENAGIAKLWQGFHHLSENDKDLVLTLAEAAGHSMRDTRTIPEQSVGRCGTSVTGITNAKTPISEIC